MRRTCSCFVRGTISRRGIRSSSSDFVSADKCVHTLGPILTSVSGLGNSPFRIDLSPTQSSAKSANAPAFQSIRSSTTFDFCRYSPGSRPYRRMNVLYPSPAPPSAPTPRSRRPSGPPASPSRPATAATCAPPCRTYPWPWDPHREQGNRPVLKIETRRPDAGGSRLGPWSPRVTANGWTRQDLLPGDDFGRRSKMKVTLNLSHDGGRHGYSSPARENLHGTGKLVCGRSPELREHHQSSRSWLA